MRSGLYATFEGMEYSTALTTDQREAILLVPLVGDYAPPEGFEESQPGLYRRVVPRADLTSLYRVHVVCTYRGARFQVIEDDGELLRLKYLGGQERVAEELGLDYVEPGVYQASARADEIDDCHEVRNDLHRRLTERSGEGGPTEGGVPT